MSLNDEIILLEYFTANFVAGNHKKQIVKEAQNLVNYISLYFTRNKNLKKIHLIRNSHSKKINSKKIQNHIITKNKSINFILKKFKKKKIILIAPETDKINLKFVSKLKKKFNLLISDFDTLKTFSSKKKTFQVLNKKNIPVVKIEKKIPIKSNLMFLKKPIYGAGSENINLISRMPRNTDKIIIQEYHPGIKGSFSMICCKKKKIVLSCNKQIHKIKKNKISQQGNINGGLENYRSEIEKLAEKIVKNFPGLFGFVGVDIVKIKGTWHVIEINPRFTSSIISLEDTYGSDSIKNLTDFYIYEKIKNIKIKLKKKIKVDFT